MSSNFRVSTNGDVSHVYELIGLQLLVCIYSKKNAKEQLAETNLVGLLIRVVLLCTGKTK